jgi:hypothetical protein
MTLLDYLPSLHKAATPRIDPAIWPLTTTVDELGRLCVGEVPLTDIADEHSMASNYNMVGRPPIIAVKHGDSAELVRRETTADLLGRDRGWSGGVRLHD